MKKILMILGNVLIVTVILIFVSVYIDAEQKRILASQTESFESMTVAMENVTTNYLVGEQQVCNTWANYINSRNMTAEEATFYNGYSTPKPNLSDLSCNIHDNRHLCTSSQ